MSNESLKGKKRFAINLSSQIISFVINIGINFFLSSYIVNSIGKEIYGYVGLANNFTSYVQVFTVAFNSMLNRHVTIYFTQKKYEKANQYMTSITICDIVISLLLFIPSVAFCCLLEYVIVVPDGYLLQIKILFLFIFISFLLNLATSTFQTAFFASNRLDLSAKRSLENYILKAVLLVVLYSCFKPHIWYVGLVTLLCTAFLSIINKLYMKRLMPQLQISISFFSINAIKDSLGVGIWSSFNQLSQLLLTGLDLLIANLFLGAGDMGLLSIAKTIPTQLVSFIAMVSNVFTPRMTIAYAEGSKDKFIKETTFSMKMCGAICSVPLLGFVVFGSSFIRLWMPSLSMSEIQEVQILSVLTLLPQLCSVYIYPLYSVNTITCKLKIPVLVTIGIGIMNVGIVYILLLTTNLGVYAIAGVSSILLVLRIVFFVPIYAACNLNMRWTTFYPELIKGLLSSGIIGGAFLIISKIVIIKSWIELMFVAFFGAIFGYMLCVICLFSKEEKKRIVLLATKLYRDKILKR